MANATDKGRIQSAKNIPQRSDDRRAWAERHGAPKSPSLSAGAGALLGAPGVSLMTPSVTAAEKRHDPRRIALGSA